MQLFKNVKTIPSLWAVKKNSQMAGFIQGP